MVAYIIIRKDIKKPLKNLIKLNKYVEINGENVLIDNWKDNFKHSAKK